MDLPASGFSVLTNRWVSSEMIPSTPQPESQRMDLVSLTVHTKSWRPAEWTSSTKLGFTSRFSAITQSIGSLRQAAS
jgi:hypothetical protein